MQLNKRSIFLVLSIIGPGLVAANAGNDAGGIATYATVGAKYGYSMLWMLFIIAFSLAIVQEMAARMGAVSGKGLSDLIRERFGVRWTFFAMACLLFANTATTASDFAGIAASMEIFGVPKYLTVPLVGFGIWWLVVKGTYRMVEKVFLLMTTVFITYVISGFLARPSWSEVLAATVTPSFSLDSHYVMMVIATVGTTITPWMQFFLQSSIVDKGVTAAQYKFTRIDVLFGSIVSVMIVFFIIVSTAATLHVSGVAIETVKDAALALGPVAGPYAQYLFAIGLFGASMLTASIVPLSTAYAICEGFGWESGLDRQFDEAPLFFGLYTALLTTGAVIVLVPGISLYWIMLAAQTISGILLPIILIFMLLLINNRSIMGEHVNSPVYNFVAWLLSVVLIILSLILLITTLMPGLLPSGA